MSEQQQATNIMKDMFGVFNRKAEDVKFKKEEESTGGLFFKPDPKNSPGQTFRGVIKFLPNLQDIDNGTVTKVTYWVPEGANGGFRYDSPKSLGKYENCIVANKYWELKGSDDARLKALAGKITYGKNTFALIQVIKDMTNPENDGKIMIWDLPVAIQKKVNSIMYPAAEDIALGAVANNIFDPINGQVMILKIPIKTVEENGKTKEYRDYDGCEFSDKISNGMILAGEKQQLQLATEPAALEAQQTKMLETILAGPNLQDYAYKAPTEAILARATKALAELTGQPMPAQPAQPAQPSSTDNATPGTSEPTAQSNQESGQPAEVKNEAPAQPDQVENQVTNTNVAESPTAVDPNFELMKELGLTPQE